MDRKISDRRKEKNVMKNVILTGDRPTGKLHIGHYVGSLKRRVELQNSGAFDKIYIMIADAQALTDNFDNPDKVRANITEVALDYFACGIDPKKSTVFIQSYVTELTELTFYYMNLVTLARLERNPTVKAEIKQHVRKEGKRVVIQDIPMVDQGQKGYCVVATAARIFAYYGMDYVDQHELASLANTSADGGTNTAAMAENLKKIGTRFQIRIKVLDSLANSRDFRNLLKAYNRAASKLKKEKVENEHDWSGFWDNADGEVLKLARAGSPSQVDRWLNAIRPYIMAGIPVFWSVQLGIVPEPLRLSQTRGGHLRLIIGFDEEKKTLIFSDSWGAAHTEKEMPLADAIAITTGRQVMQPSK